jgi:hypothetical protein
MSLSGRARGGLLVIVVQPVFRLLEDMGQSIVLRDFKLVAIGAVKFDQSSFGNTGQGQDVGNTVGAVPHLAISWYRSSQLCHRLPGLSVDCQTTTYFVNVTQQIRVMNCSPCHPMTIQLMRLGSRHAGGLPLIMTKPWRPSLIRQRKSGRIQPLGTK